MTLELRSALDNAYVVFARYPMPNYLGLRGNLQLRDLGIGVWHQLNEEHDMGVLMYSDDGSMLRYFLPRWLDWLSDDIFYIASSDWGIWWLGYRLAHARWRDWPADEVAALRAVFEAWTREEIFDNDGAPAASWKPERIEEEDGESMGLVGFSVDSELLRFLAEVGDVAAYLELWLDTNLPQLARWLWMADLSSYHGAREWIVSSRLESELEAAFFADSDGENAELFSRSIELVRSLRAL